MRKSVLLLATLVPLAIGCLINILFTVPVIGMAAYYLLPLVTTVFWFYLGRQYARIWKAIPAVLLAHALGFCSLLVYLWQLLFETDGTRSPVLTAFSQMFSASTPLYLFNRIAALFESRPNYLGTATMVALQIIALVYMVVVFCIGVYWEKRQFGRGK